MIKKDFSKIGDPVVVVSHPRSGTHLTIDLLRKQFISLQSLRYPFEGNHYLYLSIEAFLDNRKNRGMTQETAMKIVKRPKRPIIKLHTYSYTTLCEKFPDWMAWIEEKGKFIFVVRDVRKVLKSYHSYARSFEAAASVGMHEFVRQPFCGRPNRPFYWNETVLEWTGRNNVLVLKYEDILSDPRDVLIRVGKFIQETPIFAEPFLPKQSNNVWVQRMERIFSRNPESTAILATEHATNTEYDQNTLEFIADNAAEGLRLLNYSMKKPPSN